MTIRDRVMLTMICHAEHELLAEKLGNKFQYVGRRKNADDETAVHHHGTIRSLSLQLANHVIKRFHGAHHQRLRCAKCLDATLRKPSSQLDPRFE